jgi:potassium/chloride transporter 4/5/6
VEDAVMTLYGSFFQACRLLSTYIDYKKCEGVAEVIVASNVVDGFRLIVQTMGLGNLKPNIVCMRYPEIWREERHSYIPQHFVSIINDCSIANKAVVIVKGLDEWPGEFQKQYGTIDLYWIVRDGGLMLLLSQLLRAKDTYESCKIQVSVVLSSKSFSPEALCFVSTYLFSRLNCINSTYNWSSYIIAAYANRKMQVFCIADEDTEAEELKTDVKKFLYDLRMQAEVIVVTMKSWEVHQENRQGSEMTGREDAMEAFSKARKRIMQHAAELVKTASSSSQTRTEQNLLDDQQVNKFLLTCLKLNSVILRYSGTAAVVLVSLPPPPPHHPSICYMEYIDLLVENIPRLLMVRGYRRDVVTIFT